MFRYAELLQAAAAGPEPAIIGFQTIADAYPNATILQLPYFDGDNWPDIIEDILKFDIVEIVLLMSRVEDKAAEEERKQSSVQQMVDQAYAQAVQEVEGEVCVISRTWC